MSTPEEAASLGAGWADSPAAFLRQLMASSEPGGDDPGPWPARRFLASSGNAGEWRMVRDQAERDALGDNWHRSPDEAVAARARGGKPAVAPVDETAICRELFDTLPERLID